MKKKIPVFKTVAEEQKFWQKHDSTDYIDWSKGKRAQLPKLKPSTKQISLRLSERLLNAIKIKANKEDVPYQSLMKTILEKDVCGSGAVRKKSTQKERVSSPAKRAARRSTTRSNKKTGKLVSRKKA